MVTGSAISSAMTGTLAAGCTGGRSRAAESWTSGRCRPAAARGTDQPVVGSVDDEGRRRDPMQFPRAVTGGDDRGELARLPGAVPTTPVVAAARNVADVVHVAR